MIANRGNPRFQGPRLTAATARPCPTCDAPIGEACRRAIGGRVRGKDVGGAYVKRLASVHRARTHNPDRPDVHTDGDALAAPVDPRTYVLGAQRRREMARSKVHVVGGCGRAMLDLTRAVPAANVPREQRCGRSGCRTRWPATVPP
jgi:hypothetical protein